MSKYHGRADPLEQLKNAYSNPNPKVKLVTNKDVIELYFDKITKFNLKAQTAWVATQSQKRYCLGSLWLFMEFHLKNIQKSQYYSKAAQYDLDTVIIADQDQIIKYFTGKIATTPCINQQLKLSLSQGRKRDHPVGGFDNAEHNIMKKVKDQQNLSFQQQVIQCLATYERPVNSKSRCLHYNGKSFSGIIKNLMQSQDQATKPQKIKGRSRISTIYEKKRLPIIIVPHYTHSGNISLQNIQKFLIDEIYSEDQKLQNQYASKLQLQKHMRDKNIIFQVTSRPNLLTQKQWDYVVAIFVQGKQNQFDGWPHKDPKKIFEKPCGFFVHYPKTSTFYTRDWRVKNILIDRNTRYGDKQVAKTIWTQIQKFIFERI